MGELVLRHWMQDTVEWQNWGWNALTVSFIATVAFTVFQGWGVWKQNETIRMRRSGESVSVLLFAYFSCVFFSFLYYGFIVRSIAAACNGLLGFLHVLVLASLWRFKGFTSTEKVVVAALPLMIVAMATVPWKNTLLLLIMAGSLLPLAQQPIEMWRNKSAGAVDMRFVSIFMASTIFWTIYAFAIDNWVLKVINPSALAILVVTSSLWYRYRRPGTLPASGPQIGI